MAQVDFFLKIEGVDGESTDDKHKNEIDLSTWGFGAATPTTVSPGAGAGAGAGKVSLHDFRFTKKIDKASPKLFQACCSGTHLKTATLTCRRAGPSPFEFVTVTLGNVVVDSYDASGATASGEPLEQVSLAYATIQIRYTPQAADGSVGGLVSGGWDALANKTF